MNGADAKDEDGQRHRLQAPSQGRVKAESAEFVKMASIFWASCHCCGGNQPPTENRGAVLVTNQRGRVKVEMPTTVSPPFQGAQQAAPCSLVLHARWRTRCRRRCRPRLKVRSLPLHAKVQSDAGVHVAAEVDAFHGARHTARDDAVPVRRRSPSPALSAAPAEPCRPAEQGSQRVGRLQSSCPVGGVPSPCLHRCMPGE